MFLCYFSFPTYRLDSLSAMEIVFVTSFKLHGKVLGNFFKKNNVFNQIDFGIIKRESIQGLAKSDKEIRISSWLDLV